MHNIYMIINTINNKKYIGETKQSLNVRYSKHLSHARKNNRNGKLYDAIREYGAENFKIELVEKCKYEDRHDREEYWISYYDSYNNGYNNAPRQYVTSKGYKFSEERKLEYSQKFKGENNPMYGKNVKDYMDEGKICKWKENLSKARKGKKFSQSHKEQLSKSSTRKKSMIKVSDENIIIEEYESLTVLSKSLNMSPSTVLYKIKNHKKINGFYYKYKDDKKM